MIMRANRLRQPRRDVLYALILHAFLQGAEEAAAVARVIGGKGLILGVHGIPGVAIDTGTFIGIRAALALCPGIRLDDSLTGGFR
jgi:ribose transport system substrate-binding protein